MEIITLLKANIQHKKSNFISILLLMIIISTVLTSVISTQNNISNRAYQANEKVGTGDLVLFIKDKYLTDEMLSNVESCECVEKVNAVKSFIISEADISNTKVDTPLYFTAYDKEKHNYEIFSDDAKSFIENTDTLQDGEVYLPLSMKKTYSCNKGDKLRVKLNNGTSEFVIAGFIEEPFLGSDVITIKNLIITQNDFDKIYTENITEQSDDILNDRYVSSIDFVHIFAAQEYSTKINQLITEVNDASNIVSFSASTMTKEQSITYTLLLPKILCGVLYIFLFLLFVIVVLVLSNNIGTSIEMDYVNLGILKSQGFSKQKIRLVLLMQYLMPAIIGSLIGFILSFPIVNFIKIIFIITSGLLFPSNVMIGKSTVMLLFILVILGVFVFAKTRKISKISPIRAISGGIEDLHFSSILQAPVLGKSKLFLGFKLALRQLTSNIRQYAGTCFIMSVLVLYLSTCASFKETFTEKFYNEMYGIVSSDVRINFNGNIEMQEEVEKEISAVSRIKESFFYQTKYFLIDGIQYNAQILDNADYLTSVVEGRAPKYDNEIVVTDFLCKQLNKKIGDRTEIEYGNNKYEFIISGIYDSCNYAGNTFALTLDGTRRLDSDFKADSRNYIIENSADRDKVVKAVTEKFADKDIQTEKTSVMSESTIRTVMATVTAMVSFLYGVAILFAVIVIWMVCNKSFLKEKHDLGIYKAYGFTSLSIRIQFCIRYFIVAFIGSIIGAVLYIFFGNDLNSTTLVSLGVTKFEAPLTLSSLLIPPAIVYVFVIIAAFVTLRKVKSVDTRELIVE